MANEMIINIVTTKCKAEDEAKFNKWYNEIHIPMLLKYKGLTGVVRYKILDKPLQYMAIYKFAGKKEFDAFHGSQEFMAATRELQDTWGTLELVSAVPGELIKEW